MLVTGCSSLVIAVESNILVYVHKAESPWHHDAVRVLHRLTDGGLPWAIPWPCLHEFFDISTHPKIYQPPSAPEQALEQIDAWIEGGAVFIGEASDHLDRLRDLVTDGRVVGGMVHDAKIAAICLSHGIDELWTADRDFSRFPALKTRNPFVGAA